MVELKQFLSSHIYSLYAMDFFHDREDEYFVDGMTEELITALSKIRELRVIARTSVMQYKQTTKTIAEIGHELDAPHILEGSVRKEDNRLRITLQLIEAQKESLRGPRTARS